MDDVLVVGRLDGAGQRLDQFRGLPRRQRRAGQLLVEASAGAVLHREEGPAVVLADLEDLHHVGMR